MSGDSLGDRMKRYEDASRHYLTSRLPLIIRLDGKAFHTWTRGLPRPYCASLMAAMNEVALYLCKGVQNCVMAYTQSDEISLLLIDYKAQDTCSWFDSNLQKIVSVSAGMASAKLTALSPTIFGGTRDDLRLATFDARAFVLPPHEIENYFIWRQQDWERNSLQMLAQSLYSQKELHGKGRAELNELCFRKGFNWADLSSHLKNGRVAVQRQVVRDLPPGPDGYPRQVMRREWYVPDETPIFVNDRQYIWDVIERS